VATTEATTELKKEDVLPAKAAATAVLAKLADDKVLATEPAAGAAQEATVAPVLATSLPTDINVPTDTVPATTNTAEVAAAVEPVIKAAEPVVLAKAADTTEATPEVPAATVDAKQKEEEKEEAEVKEETKVADTAAAELAAVPMLEKVADTPAPAMLATMPKPPIATPPSIQTAEEIVVNDILSMNN